MNEKHSHSQDNNYNDSELLGQLLNQAQLAIVFCNGNQIIERINPEFTRMFGYAEEEAIGKDLYDLITPEELRNQSTKISNHLENKERIEFETVRRAKDGRMIPVLCRVSPRIKNNKNVGGFAFYSDISERKRALDELQKAHEKLEHRVEERTRELKDVNKKLKAENRERKRIEEDLRESEELFRMFFEHAGFAILLIDPLTGKRLAFNKRAYEELGYTKEEYEATGVGNVHHTKIIKNTVNEHFQRVMKKGHDVEEFSYFTKDGESRTFLISSVFLRVRGKQLIQAIRADITTHKKTESKLLEAQKTTEIASMAKGEFLANMSHEIRTPLNGVMGVLNLLLSTHLNHEQLDLVETGKRSADSLLTVINDILDFSKIEAGKLDMEILDFNLRNAIEEIMELPAMQAHEKMLEFVYEIKDEIPSLLKGDPGRLRQILLNLTNNAIKFTDQGEVVVRVFLQNETDAHAKIRFEVQDTGMGIPTEKLKDIFKSFKQTDSSTTRKYGGTGLGLSISGKLVELMNGEIGVNSEMGMGSTFWFTACFEKQCHVEEKRLIPPADLIGKRFLVVDDNKTNLDILCGYLESWGCYCDMADSAGVPLSLMNAVSKVDAPFDAVITDMRMPGMDGAELGKCIQSDPKLNGTNMIMLTFIGLRGDAAKVKKIGFAAYLTKPIRRSQLFECITAVLGNKLEDALGGEPQIVTKHTIYEKRREKNRLLIVEDNIVNQKLALRTIEKFGFQGDVAANGREALRALESFQYDAVLMDVQMPVMDGLEATREIRNPKSAIMNHDIPIIAMTAIALKGDRERCIASGMDDYVSKPIRPQELLKAIEKQISGRTGKADSC